MSTSSHASMQSLLAEEDFVRALARHLLGDDGADDLIQDTWLAALRARAGARDPRSWLATVLRRLAANRRRGDARRERRERHAPSAPFPAAPSTAAILACEEVRRRVVAAVLALEEPFQRTVVARYYEGLDSTQIAARDGIEVATVRSRLKRGLDRLRSRLDAEHDGDRAAWAGPLALLGRGNPPTAGQAAAAVSPPAKVAVVVAAGMVVALAIWSLAPSTPPAAPASGSGTAAAGAAVGGDERPGPPRARSGALANAAPSRAEARAPLPFPVLDTPLATASVRVVDASTRQPVAGAVVRYQHFALDLFHPRARSDFRVWELGSDQSTLTRQFGERTVSDAHGLATVRVPQFGGLLQAEAGDRFGETNCWPAYGSVARVFELALERDHSLVVRIVDASSGTPVAGRMIQVTSQGLSETRASFADSLGPSDEAGIIRHWIPLDFSRLRVRPHTIGRSDFVVVDVGGAARPVAEIRYPTTGSLVVELRTPSGRLWPGRIQASVEPLLAPRFAADDYRPARAANVEPGSYRVPRVETGHSYRITVQPAGRDAIGFGAALATDIAGPVQADEEVRITLTSAREPCILAATLRLAGGSLPPPGLWAEVAGEHRIDGAWQTATFAERMPFDESGRIAWTVPANRPVRGSIHLRQGHGDESQAPDFRCRWESASGLSPGTHDLGTLVLESPRLVLAGTVEIGERPWQSPPVAVQVEAPAADGTWDHLQGFLVFPEDSRAFEVRAFTDAERLRVRLVPKPYLLPSEPIVVAAGTRDLRLVVDRGSELRARVLAPRAYARAVACRVVREDGSALPAADRDGGPRGEASLVDFDGEATHFVWPALPAGSYRIEVLAPGLEAPLAILAGMRVGEGRATDPRLQAIDVRHRARTLTVTVDPARSAPRPITDARVFAAATRDGKTQRHGMMFDEQGTATLLVGPDAVDLAIAVPGCRLRRVAAFTGSSIHVDPEPGIQVPFRLAPHVAETFAGHRLEVFLEPRQDADRAAGATGQITFVRPGRGDTSRMDAHELAGALGGSRGSLADASLPPGRILVPVADVGTFDLWLRVGGKRLDNRRRIDDVANVTPATVQVTGTGMADVVIDVAEAALTRTLEELARDR